MSEPVKLNETSGCWSYLCILQGLDGWPGLVDPYLGGQGRSERASSAEPFGAGGEGVVEDLLAAGLDRPRGAVVDGGGCMKADAGMAVLGVIESEEGAAESSCVFQGLEAAGECRAVLEGLELRFAVGLSSETCGREWDFSIRRSDRSWATVLEVIEVPLSAWMYAGFAPPLAMIAFSMNVLARSPFSP